MKKNATLVSLLNEFFTSRTPSMRSFPREQLYQRRNGDHTDLMTEMRRIEQELDLPSRYENHEMTSSDLCLNELRAIKFHVEPGLLSEWKYYKTMGFARDDVAVVANFRKQGAILLIEDNILFLESILLPA
jgi:hypothetical protein